MVRKNLLVLLGTLTTSACVCINPDTTEFNACLPDAGCATTGLVCCRATQRCEMSCAATAGGRAGGSAGGAAGGSPGGSGGGFPFGGGDAGGSAGGDAGGAAGGDAGGTAGGDAGGSTAGGTAGGVAGGTAGGVAGGTAGGVAGGTAGGLGGGGARAGGVAGGTAGGVAGGTAGGLGGGGARAGGTAGGTSGGLAGGTAGGISGGVAAGGAAGGVPVRLPYAARIVEPAFTRITNCLNITVTLIDDAGVQVAAPDGGLSVPFDISLPDGGPHTPYRARTPVCGQAPLSVPGQLSFTAGTSNRQVGIEFSSFPSNERRMLVTVGGGPTLRADSRLFLAAEPTLSTNLAVLPLFDVAPDGGLSLRRYAVMDNYSEWAGDLENATPSTHIIRMTNTRAMLIQGIYDLRLGTFVAGSSPAFSPVHGMTRVFDNRVMLFGGQNGSVRFQSIEVTGSGFTPGGVQNVNVSQSQVPFSFAGEVAAEYFRNQGTRTTGSTDLWFVTIGNSGALIGRLSYSYFGNESYGTASTLGTSTPFANQTAVSLEDGKVLLVTNDTEGVVPTTVSSAVFEQKSLSALSPGQGPVQIAHSTGSTQLVGTLQGVMSGPTGRTRNIDLMAFDATLPAGAAPLARQPLDLDIGTGSHAINDPTQARGCVINDRNFGVYFFYSVRSPGDSTYRHYYQRYSNSLGAQTLIQIPDAERQVISCGGSVFHSVDMWYR